MAQGPLEKRSLFYHAYRHACCIDNKDIISTLDWVKHVPYSAVMKLIRKEKAVRMKTAVDIREEAL